MSKRAFRLLPHPAAPAVARALHVDARLSAAALSLRFRLDGACRWPPRREPARADELWRHTCCELFAAGVDAPAYREFNFSPSGEWAAYAFADCRRREEDPPVAVPPRLTFEPYGDGFALGVELDRVLLPAPPWCLGLAAVVEGGTGELAYWALAHPRPHPDFHDRAGFVGLLPAP